MSDHVIHVQVQAMTKKKRAKCNSVPSSSQVAAAVAANVTFPTTLCCWDLLGKDAALGNLDYREPLLFKFIASWWIIECSSVNIHVQKAGWTSVATMSPWYIPHYTCSLVLLASQSISLPSEAFDSTDHVPGRQYNGFSASASTPSFSVYLADTLARVSCKQLKYQSKKQCPRLHCCGNTIGRGTTMRFQLQNTTWREENNPTNMQSHQKKKENNSGSHNACLMTDPQVCCWSSRLNILWWNKFFGGTNGPPQNSMVYRTCSHSCGQSWGFRCSKWHEWDINPSPPILVRWGDIPTPIIPACGFLPSETSIYETRTRVTKKSAKTAELLGWIWSMQCTLWYFDIAIEHGQSIVVCSIENGDSP